MSIATLGDELLRSRDEFFKALFEHGGVGIMSNDDQGRFIEVNDSSLEFFGVERSDLLGQTLIGYTHPDDRPRAAEQIRKLIAGEVESWRWESLFLRKDGEERWGDVAASAIRWPDGRFKSGITVIADITARKRQEQELRRVREAAEAAKREILAGELRVAQQIQRGMVPKDFRGLAVEVHALLEPAHEVGGDLYDVFPLDDGRVCIVLGDVSGKGVPAALFMAVTATLLRATARHVQRPEQILSHVNQELARDNPTSMFVTLFCAVLDTRTGKLSCASGGHTSPVLARPGEPPRFLLDRTGTLLGIQSSLTFEATDLQLLPGDALFLYTDGVTEAFDPERRCFGEERLLEVLQEGAPGPREMVDQVIAAVRAFARGEPQSDDIALLAFRWAPELVLHLRSTAADVARGYQAVQRFLTERGAPRDAIDDVALAVEELLANLLRHGYAGADGPISLRATLTAFEIRLELRDRSVPFDPRVAQLPNLALPLDERTPGELGLHLVRSAVDRISYERDGDENLLTLVRRLPPKE
jgi:sigma-B regulation protein RsbU (phosphoserine phosphatase)